MRFDAANVGSSDWRRLRRRRLSPPATRSRRLVVPGEAVFEALARWNGGCRSPVARDSLPIVSWRRSGFSVEASVRLWAGDTDGL